MQGFVHWKSSLTGMLEFFEEVKKRIDKGSTVDMCKAFDKVPLGKLLDRMGPRLR